MAMLEVASNNSGTPIKLSYISINQNIPLNFLEQIFLKLKKADIVRSVKGPGGGYILNIEAEKLNIANILDAVEENIKMTRCSRDAHCRKNGVKCQTHDLWKGLTGQIRTYFSNISIADIIAGQIGMKIR